MSAIESWRRLAHAMLRSPQADAASLELARAVLDLSPASEVSTAEFGVWNLNGKGGWCYATPGDSIPFRGSRADAESLCGRLAAEGRSRYEVRPLVDDTAELIAEARRALEGVTEGPWTLMISEETHGLFLVVGPSAETRSQAHKNRELAEWSRNNLARLVDALEESERRFSAATGCASR